MKIAIVASAEKQQLDIIVLLRERNRADKVQAVTGTLERLIRLSDLESPDVLVLADPTVERGDLGGLEHLSHLHPHMAIILLCQTHSADFLLQAMRVGVREVVSLPLVSADLVQALERIEGKLIQRVRAEGKVLAFISCKGGSGATFIATNLGYALASEENKRVALIDLNLQFGDASLFVSDQKPMTTISDVSRDIHRLDASFLSSSMLNVAPNFSLLAAPDDPAQVGDVKPEHIDKILKLARRHYDFIVLDVGRSLDAVCIRALDQADMIFPVLQTTLPYIRDGKRLLGVFRSLDYEKEKVHLIVNRHEKNGEISLHDLELAYGTKDLRTVPNHYEAAAASVNQGVPILKLDKTSPVSKALQAFAAALAGETSPISKSWLGRTFGRAQAAAVGLPLKKETAS